MSLADHQLPSCDGVDIAGLSSRFNWSEEDTVLVRTLIAAAVALGLTASANASTITIVPGTSDPWLAGMPNGSTASLLDIAPAQSPVQVLLAFLPGDALRFSATG